MGKRVIVAADGPGFLVNRCGRPFAAEALRLLQERVAGHEQVDRICRLGGGFRMGPFELMDLVGIDVGLEVAQSFSALSFGEPRWRPSPLQAQMVAAGRLGRKSGRGWYDYPADASTARRTCAPPAAGGADGTAVAIVGHGPLADGLRERARDAGYALREGAPAELVVDAGLEPASKLPGGAPLIVLCAGRSLATRGEPAAVGFHLLPPVAETRLVEPHSPAREPALRGRRGRGVLRASRSGVRVGGGRAGPGARANRLSARQRGSVRGGRGRGHRRRRGCRLTLGLNHPRGPLAWGEEMGLEHVAAVLDGLWSERREERYRPAPLLVRRNYATRAPLQGLAACQRVSWPRSPS